MDNNKYAARDKPRKQDRRLVVRSRESISNMY